MNMKEFLEDKGCQNEELIAHIIEDYGIKKNSYDLAHWIMLKLNENLSPSPNSISKKDCFKFNCKRFISVPYQCGHIACKDRKRSPS